MFSVLLSLIISHGSVVKEAPLTIMDYTNEIYCLAEAVYFESGNQSFKGKIGVSHTILNRVNHRRWANNVCDVINQNKQFSYKSDRRYKEYKYEPIESNAIFDSLIVAFGTKHKRYSDITNGATHYLNLSIASDKSWYRKLEPKGTIGAHSFYYEK